jgi:hypothetical protein
MKGEKKKRERTQIATNIDPELKKSLYKALIDEGMSFRKWLELKIEEYIKFQEEPWLKRETQQWRERSQTAKRLGKILESQKTTYYEWVDKQAKEYLKKREKRRKK